MAINNQPTIEPRTVTGIFTKYIAKTLPLAFDESMSYYECLCALLEYLNEKIVPDINNTNAGLSELQTFYLQLQDYVNNYFDNLDVQEEINNKLDTMAESGELTQIIKNYVDPIYQAYETEINAEIESQNSRITSVESALESVASGSPAGVYATVADLTQADPDHSRTYVVSADGKWYYYNASSSSWVAGGIYQTSESGDEFNILNNEIDYANINIYDETMAISGYINSNGIQTTTGTQKYAKVPITELTTYYLYRKSQNYLGGGDWFAFVDNTDTLFDITVFRDNIVQINGNKYLEIKAPAGALYVIFNVKLSIYDDLSSSILYTKNTLANLNGYDKELRDKIEILKNKYYINKLNKTYILNYCVIKPPGTNVPNYQYVNNTSSSKTYLDAEKKYYLYRKSQNYSVIGDTITYWNSSNELIGYDIISTLSKITLLNDEKCVEFTTPENTNYIRVNIHLTTNYDDTNGTIISEFPTEYEYLANDKALRDYVDENFISKQPALYNRLRNKKWLCLGDSITAANFRSSKNYHDYIAERTGIIVTNLGHNGAGYIQQGNNICNTIDGLDGTEGYDYITIFAGTNDRSQPLGSFGSTDKTNLYGAINYAITELIRKFPNAKIGILTPLPRSTNYGIASNQKLYQIANAEIEVANNYSIPVLNQYLESGLRPWNATNNETFFSCEESPQGDGLHPNELGHEWISYPIQEFLQSL